MFYCEMTPETTLTYCTTWAMERHQNKQMDTGLHCINITSSLYSSLCCVFDFFFSRFFKSSNLWLAGGCVICLIFGCSYALSCQLNIRHIPTESGICVTFSQRSEVQVYCFGCSCYHHLDKCPWFSFEENLVKFSFFSLSSLYSL